MGTERERARLPRRARAAARSETNGAKLALAGLAPLRALLAPETWDAVVEELPFGLRTMLADVDAHLGARAAARDPHRLPRLRGAPRAAPAGATARYVTALLGALRSVLPAGLVDGAAAELPAELRGALGRGALDRSDLRASTVREANGARPRLAVCPPPRARLDGEVPRPPRQLDVEPRLAVAGADLDRAAVPSHDLSRDEEPEAQPRAAPRSFSGGRWNASNACSSMPGASRRGSPPRRRPARPPPRRTTSMRVSGSPWSTAFERTFERTCSSREGSQTPVRSPSASTWMGLFGWNATSSSTTLRASSPRSASRGSIGMPAPRRVRV